MYTYCQTDVFVTLWLSRIDQKILHCTCTVGIIENVGVCGIDTNPRLKNLPGSTVYRKLWLITMCIVTHIIVWDEMQKFFFFSMMWVSEILNSSRSKRRQGCPEMASPVTLRDILPASYGNVVIVAAGSVCLASYLRTQVLIARKRYNIEVMHSLFCVLMSNSEENQRGKSAQSCPHIHISTTTPYNLQWLCNEIISLDYEVVTPGRFTLIAIYPIADRALVTRIA